MTILRPELVPPKLDPDRVEYLAQLAARIFQYLCLDLDAQLLIDHFSQLTSCAPNLLEQSVQLHSIDPREFVERLLAPRPGRIPDLTHAELSELIRRIIEREGRPYEICFWSDVLHANLPAHVYNRLYNAMNWPIRPMTPEEMLIDAMSQPLPGM